MKRTRVFALIVLASMLQACAVGNKYTLDNLDAGVRLPGNGPVTVAAQDRRTYILNGDKSPNFVGLQRGGYGNPFNVGTASGNSLADDVAASLSVTLRSAGYEPITVAVASKDDEAAVISRLTSRQARRAILLVINELKSDTYMNVALHYDLTLKVLDAGGAVLAESNATGKDDLGGSAWNPPAVAKREVPVAVRTHLKRLLESPQVQEALR